MGNDDVNDLQTIKIYIPHYITSTVVCRSETWYFGVFLVADAKSNSTTWRTKQPFKGLKQDVRVTPSNTNSVFHCTAWAIPLMNSRICTD